MSAYRDLLAAVIYHLDDIARLAADAGHEALVADLAAYCDATAGWTEADAEREWTKIKWPD